MDGPDYNSSNRALESKIAGHLRGLLSAVGLLILILLLAYGWYLLFKGENRDVGIPSKEADVAGATSALLGAQDFSNSTSNDETYRKRAWWSWIEDCTARGSMVATTGSWLAIASIAYSASLTIICMGAMAMASLGAAILSISGLAYCLNGR